MLAQLTRNQHVDTISSAIPSVFIEHLERRKISAPSTQLLQLRWTGCIFLIS
jgi:hypothetical protein